ncbi:hypothetical protein [Paenibacillus taichungensis]|uniref:hypothetical protein n=1 Tax=Paenibacillus taichungensis TaxID=484184 RepID=UPI00215CB001|nr:hypothetical protein [Paenibacillus taichungensis]
MFNGLVDAFDGKTIEPYEAGMELAANELFELGSSPYSTVMSVCLQTERVGEPADGQGRIQQLNITEQLRAAVHHYAWPPLSKHEIALCHR